MTTILAAMQNSLLVLDSIKEGWKIHEHLKHHSPNSVALDPDNPSTAYCGLLMLDFGELLMAVNVGIKPL